MSLRMGKGSHYNRLSVPWRLYWKPQRCCNSLKYTLIEQTNVNLSMTSCRPHLATQANESQLLKLASVCSKLSSFYKWHVIYDNTDLVYVYIWKTNASVTIKLISQPTLAVTSALTIDANCHSGACLWALAIQRFAAKELFLWVQ